MGGKDSRGAFLILTGGEVRTDFRMRLRARGGAQGASFLQSLGEQIEAMMSLSTADDFAVLDDYTLMLSEMDHVSSGGQSAN